MWVGIIQAFATCVDNWDTTFTALQYFMAKQHFFLFMEEANYFVTAVIGLFIYLFITQCQKQKLHIKHAGISISKATSYAKRSSIVRKELQC